MKLADQTTTELDYLSIFIFNSVILFVQRHLYELVRTTKVSCHRVKKKQKLVSEIKNLASGTCFF